MQNPRTVPFERRGGAGRAKLAAPKPRAWSHQNDLKDLVGKQIMLRLANDTREVGTLIAADQFTFKLVRESQSVVTFFKHAVTSYAPLEN